MTGYSLAPANYPMPANMDDNELRWKNKFLASLDDAERQEKQSRHTERSLQEGLSNLALSAYGLHQDVDTLLDQLRAAIRSRQSSDIAIKLISRIQHASADLTREVRPVDSSPLPSEELIQLLRALPLSGKAAKRARRLEQQLLEGSGNPQKNVAEISALVSEVLASNGPQVCPGPSPRKTGNALLPIKRLFARAPDTSGALPVQNYDALLDQIANRIVDLDALHHDLGVWQSRLSALHGESEPAAVADVLVKLCRELCESTTPVADPPSQVLLELLQHLDLPHQYQAPVEAMRERLGATQDVQTTSQVITELAGLIGNLRGEIDQERHDMEEFLAALTSRLGGLDQLLSEMSVEHADTVDQSDAFSLNVLEQVNELQHEVYSATDLNMLKTKVNERIERLGTQLAEYLEQGRTSTVQLNRHVLDLQEQVTELEVQTEQLGTTLARQRKLSQLDGLTGVSNRASFETALTSEHERWHRYQQPLSLLFWDIDKFKSVNDTYGHQAGDKVIQTVAKLLEQQSRASDFLARYGGEEFVMLMPETSLPVACEVAEKLRETLACAKFRYKGAIVPITASCGVAELTCSDRPHDLVERADKALYKAKQSGRNRVVAATP